MSIESKMKQLIGEQMFSIVAMQNHIEELQGQLDNLRAGKPGDEVPTGEHSIHQAKAEAAAQNAERLAAYAKHPDAEFND